NSIICFFFSSRRRHTRSKRDWSSDVCSSDLRTSGKLSEKRRNSVRGIRKRILFERRDRPPERSLFPVPSGSGTDGGKRRRKPSVYRRRRKSTWQSAV